LTALDLYRSVGCGKLTICSVAGSSNWLINRIIETRIEPAKGLEGAAKVETITLENSVTCVQALAAAASRIRVDAFPVKR
jgi:hypothetical protein